MITAIPDAVVQTGQRLNREVLSPLKAVFTDKDEIIDLMGICLVGGENLFILGPPGTAKSALVHELSRRVEGRVFEYLLTRFTEPSELFGPFDIRKLREGELVTNTEGMLPEASLIFLDEVLNANSAILNSLLTVLNERVFRRGREIWPLPTLMVVGASNRLPEDDALAALFDRFLVRVPCDNVNPELLPEVLRAGWDLDFNLVPPERTVTVEEIRQLSAVLGQVDISGVRGAFVELIKRIRRAGIAVSDRRAVKLQRIMAASALLCGRLAVHLSDLWVIRYIWDTIEQQELLAGLVDEIIKKNGADEEIVLHPRSRSKDIPDPDRLARELTQLHDAATNQALPDQEHARLADRLSLIAGRCQWIPDQQQRSYLEDQVKRIWQILGKR